MKRLALLLGASLVVLTASVTILGSFAAWLPWHLQTMPGHSMEPAIAGGSLLVTVRRPPTELKAGMVVAYHRPGRQAGVARIVRLTNQGGADNYRLQADAAAAEYTVPPAAIIGEVRYHWLVPGSTYRFLKSWPGLILGLYLPAVGLVAHEVNRLARQLAQFSLE